MIQLIDDCRITRSMMGGNEELSPFDAVSVYFGEVCLANAVNYADFDDDPTQVLLCEVCGNPGCGSAGWVHLRRLGDAVIWIPPKGLAEKDQVWQKFPPPYTKNSACGVPVFLAPLYDDLCRQLPWLPDRSKIRPISCGDALSLLQSEAPFELLGRAPESVRLRHDMILAVAEGELNCEIAAVNDFVNDSSNRDAPLTVIEVGFNARPIEFYLDAPRFPEWSGFCHLPDGLGIILRSSPSAGGTSREWILAPVER